MRSIESEAPGVNVRMVPLTTREPRPMLLRGDIDLAIGFFPGVVAQLAGGPDTPIRHERLYSGQYVCVMRKNHPLADQELTLDAYCAANHLLVSFSGRAHGLTDEALAQINRERRILLTVNQFFTAGTSGVEFRPDYRVAASPDRIDRHDRRLIMKELPFKLPDVHVDMLWHERDARNPAHKWLREHLSAMTGDAVERTRVVK